MQLNMYQQKANGMYILKKTDFDSISDMVLSEYLPNTFNYPKSTDIEYLAQECFYLDVKHQTIAPNGQVLGMIAFADAQFKTLDSSYEPKCIELEEGTMLIDMSLIGNENRARRRFTLAHELSHWICHRSYHSPTHQQYDFRLNKTTFIACRKENIEQFKKSDWSKSTDNDWEEWQADGLAAALLMPKSTFTAAFREIMSQYGFNKNYLIPGEEVNKSKKVIWELANVFDVSYKATQIRMNHLGMISMKR